RIAQILRILHLSALLHEGSRRLLRNRYDKLCIQQKAAMKSEIFDLFRQSRIYLGDNTDGCLGDGTEYGVPGAFDEKNELH
ncbi:MAG: hypothetical protein ACLFUS_11885, partial [Candidatus Sumerlaeia bacterium]